MRVARIVGVLGFAMGLAVSRDARVSAEPGSASIAAPPWPAPPLVLEAHRLQGDENIFPDDRTKMAIARTGKDRLHASFKLCLSADGDVLAVQLFRSTGFAAYDGKLARVIRQTWKYQPSMVNGARTPVCTAVRFVYFQESAPRMLAPRAHRELQTTPLRVSAEELEGLHHVGGPVEVDVQSQHALWRRGATRLVVSGDLCVSATGAIQTVKLVSTGVPRFDALVERRVRTWQYHAYELDNVAVPVCGPLSLRYTIAPGNIAPAALEARRLTGARVLEPNLHLERKFADRQLTGVFKVCISVTGAVDSVEVLKSTTLFVYDEDLKRALKLRTYRPFEIDGQLRPVCSAVWYSNQRYVGPSSAISDT